MAKVVWKRRGTWMEDNALLIFGYRLNEKNEFIECDDHTTTLIRPLDFDHFCSVELTLEEIDGEFPVKFRFGDVAYYSDIPLFNSIIKIADEILWDAVDVVRANTSDEPEEITDSTLI